MKYPRMTRRMWKMWEERRRVCWTWENRIYIFITPTIRIVSRLLSSPQSIVKMTPQVLENCLGAGFGPNEASYSCLISVKTFVNWEYATGVLSNCTVFFFNLHAAVMRSSNNSDSVNREFTEVCLRQNHITLSRSNFTATLIWCPWNNRHLPILLQRATIITQAKGLDFFGLWSAPLKSTALTYMARTLKYVMMWRCWRHLEMIGDRRSLRCSSAHLGVCTARVSRIDLLLIKKRSKSNLDFM